MTIDHRRGGDDANNHRNAADDDDEMNDDDEISDDVKIDGDAIGLQLALLEQLLEMAQQQCEVIRRGDTAGLMRLLSKKQPVVERLHRSARSAAKQFSAGELDVDGSLRKKCDAIYKEIIRLEQLSERELVAFRDRTQVEIEQLNRAAGASRAYDDVDERRSSSTLDLHCE